MFALLPHPRIRGVLKCAICSLHTWHGRVSGHQNLHECSSHTYNYITSIISSAATLDFCWMSTICLHHSTSPKSLRAEFRHAHMAWLGIWTSEFARMHPTFMSTCVVNNLECGQLRFLQDERHVFAIFPLPRIRRELNCA